MTIGTNKISTIEHEFNDREECRYTSQCVDTAMTGDQNAPSTDQNGPTLDRWRHVLGVTRYHGSTRSRATKRAKMSNEEENVRPSPRTVCPAVSPDLSQSPKARASVVLTKREDSSDTMTRGSLRLSSRRHSHQDHGETILARSWRECPFPMPPEPAKPVKDILLSAEAPPKGPITPDTRMGRMGARAVEGGLVTRASRP